MQLVAPSRNVTNPIANKHPLGGCSTNNTAIIRPWPTDQMHFDSFTPSPQLPAALNLWKQNMADTLELVIRDAEDLMLSLPYSDIRERMSSLGLALNDSETSTSQLYNYDHDQVKSSPGLPHHLRGIQLVCVFGSHLQYRLNTWQFDMPLRSSDYRH